MTLCNELDAKNTPRLLRAPTATLQLDVCESEAVSPASVLSHGVKRERHIVLSKRDLLGLSGRAHVNL